MANLFTAQFDSSHSKKNLIMDLLIRYQYTPDFCTKNFSIGGSNCKNCTLS